MRRSSFSMRWPQRKLERVQQLRLVPNCSVRLVESMGFALDARLAANPRQLLRDGGPAARTHQHERHARRKRTGDEAGPGRGVNLTDCPPIPDEDRRIDQEQACKKLDGEGPEARRS